MNEPLSGAARARRSTPVRLAAALWLAVLAIGSPVSAARPFLATEQADPIEKGSTRLEAGFLHRQFSNDDRLSSLLLELTNGMLNDLDFEVEAPVLFLQSGSSAENGLGDVSLKTKIRWLRAREGRPVSLATQFVLKLPTCNKDRLSAFNPSCTGKTDAGVVGIASKRFRSVDVHVNAGYTMVGGKTIVGPASARTRSLRDALNYSLGFVYNVTRWPQWTALAEIAGHTSTDPADAIHPLTGLIAVSYALDPAVTLDAGIGRGLTSSAPQLVGSAGATIRF
ncbi:MAG: transporter [Nitrospirota bacterium]